METFKPADGMTIEELWEAKMKILMKYDVLEIYEDDGTVAGKSGWDDLQEMLQYYLEREEYRYCAVIKKKIKRYERMWPAAEKNITSAS